MISVKVTAFNFFFTDAIRCFRCSTFFGQVETVEDGPLGAHKRRRAEGHHRTREGDGGHLRPLLRHDHCLLGSGTRLSATSHRH